VKFGWVKKEKFYEEKEGTKASSEEFSDSGLKKRLFAEKRQKTFSTSWREEDV
jgi:hypothetical protein